MTAMVESGLAALESTLFEADMADDADAQRSLAEPLIYSPHHRRAASQRPGSSRECEQARIQCPSIDTWLWNLDTVQFRFVTIFRMIPLESSMQAE